MSTHGTECHDVNDVHRLLDVLMQLDELYKKVQKPVDVVQKWSVQMYWTRALSTKRENPR